MILSCHTYQHIYYYEEFLGTLGCKLSKSQPKDSTAIVRVMVISYFFDCDGARDQHSSSFSTSVLSTQPSG